MPIIDSSAEGENDEMRQAMAKDDEAIAPYRQQMEEALQAVAGGADPQEALSKLLANVPAGIRAVLTRRFRFALEALKPKTPAQQQPPIPQVAQPIAPVQQKAAAPQRPRFGFAQAALLMATGTFDRIRAMLTKRPDIAARVQEIGLRMLGNGVQADMILLERLEQIRTQAIARLQSQQQAKSQQQVQQRER